jgi:hypothetical protein
MSIFSKLFGKNDNPVRVLTEVSQLVKGDIVVFTDSFALPEALRKQEFMVKAVNSYEYEHNTQTEWVLSGASNLELYLSLDIDDEVLLKISKKIRHQDVETLFDLDEFSTVFDEPGQAKLSKLADNDATQGWSDENYEQACFAKVGYFHRKDHRSEHISSYEGRDAGEQFELFVLYNDNDSRGIDIEVWQDGDTEVFLTLYRPTTDIIDLLPGS